MTMLYALPEIVVALGAMGLLLFGAFVGDKGAGKAAWGGVGVLLLAGLLLAMGGVARESVFHGMFLQDAFARFLKFLLLAGTGISMILMPVGLARAGALRSEGPALVLFAVLGLMLMVSASDFIALYVGVELASLPLYVLASIRREDPRSAEAGLKYFVLGALASGVMLYGISLFYGVAGGTDFVAVAQAVGTQDASRGAVLVALVFVMAGFAFKIAAVPFHMWAPDVYEGAPTPVTAFFAVAPKVAALGLLARLLAGPWETLVSSSLQIVLFLAVVSMLVGSLGGLAQTNVKRLMAYSTIAHVGVVLVALVGGEKGYTAFLVYLVLYAAGVAGFFTCLVALTRRGKEIEKVNDLAGLAKAHPRWAFVMSLFLFSLAGVPPVAGFFGKLFVFTIAVQFNMVWLAVLGVLVSVVSAGYYLRIVKVIYFDEPSNVVFDPVPEKALKVIAGGLAFFVLFFILLPAPLIHEATIAARSLF